MRLIVSVLPTISQILNILGPAPLPVTANLKFGRTCPIEISFSSKYALKVFSMSFALKSFSSWKR
jgi:hypothetical protein